ncbi:MAG: hypothetical protein ACR2G0_10535 [Chthoniobacterales bacterium]
MFRPGFHFSAAFACLTGLLSAAAQSDQEAVRVTVMMNPDGSKTVYQTDAANHQATATTKGSDGKPEGKIVYQLDADGHYQTGQVYAGNGALRFKTRYRYDDSGRLAEESQLTKDDSVENKIVYYYDALGQQAGYAVYDGQGRLLREVSHKTAPPHATPPK